MTNKNHVSYKQKPISRNFFEIPASLGVYRGVIISKASKISKLSRAILYIFSSYSPASSNTSGTDFNRHVPIKIIFFTKHLPIKKMRRQSSKFTKDQHNTHDEGCDLLDAGLLGRGKKSHFWRQKWATGWPSSTSPTRFRGSSKSQIQ